jgi:peptide/nickel transport system permease protein
MMAAQRKVQQTWWRALLASPAAIVATVMVAGLIFLAIAAGWLWGTGASATNVAIGNEGPNAAHWLGTDPLGRDILDRVLVATRSSLVLAVLATAAGGVVGVGLGMLSAAAGPTLRRLLASLISLLLSFPALLLAIFFAVIFGVGSAASVIAVGAAFAPGFARLTQTLGASIADREFIQAARMLGKGRWYVIRRHLLPNVAEPIVVYGTVHVGQAILVLSGLSFLGLGIQLPAYNWGSLLEQGLAQMFQSPAAVIAPAVAIAVAGIACNLAGEVWADVIGRASRTTRTVGSARKTSALVGAATAGGTGTPQTEPGSGEWLLRVEDLQVRFPAPGGVATPVREVSFAIRPGERLGIVGESGSGKSLTALAIAGLIRDPGLVDAQRLEFLGVDLLRPSRDRTKVLGRNLGLIFQDPGGTLNPAVRIGTHLREPAQIHLGMSWKDAAARALAALEMVRISDPPRRYKQHQHELSGGMRQRVSIAIGVAGEPRLLVADEPTTALDVIVQRDILGLLVRLSAEHDTGMILISHDLAVIAETCDRTAVMYAGFVVEEAPVGALVSAPAHPYTAALLAATPDIDRGPDQSLPTIDGRVPGPEENLPGCYFASRCPLATDRCREERPPLLSLDSTRKAACWYPLVEGGEPRSLTGAGQSDRGAGMTEVTE